MLCSLIVAVALSQEAPPPPPPPPPPAAAAFTAEMAPDGIRLVGEPSEAGGPSKEIARLRVGPLKDLLRHGTVLYAAPAEGGLLVVDVRDPLAPVITAKLLAGKPVIRIGHEGDGFLVLALADRSTAVLSVADAFHPIEASYLSNGQPEGIARGKVLAVDNGFAVIAGGTDVGFKVGDHVKILSHVELSPGEQLAEQQGLAPIQVVTAVARLTRVDATRSIALLSRGDWATVGAAVESTSQATTDSLFAPHTIPFTWRIEAALRPFVALNDNTPAAGFLGDLMVQYYFSSVPLRLEAGIEPLGLVAGGTEQHNPAIAVLDVAYAATYFELGIGAGFSTLANENICTALVACSGNQQVDVIFPVLTGRLGALDGLNLTGTYAVGWAHTGFDFGRVVEGSLNAPLSRRLTLYVEAGGGTGFAYSEVGVRTYLNGLGGPGTVILSGGIGGAGITDGLSEQPSGIALSLGFETRL